MEPEIIDPAIVVFTEVAPYSEPSRQSYIKFVEGKSPEEVRWWSKDTVAVVTGANKGVGFEIVKQLAKAGVTTILTARDESRGLAALNTLKAQGLDNILFHQLEVTDPASAAKLASWTEEKFGGLDILIGNAGITDVHMPKDYATVKSVLSINYEGQRIVTSALLPLLKPSPAGARIILVGSEFGQLQYLQNEEVKQQLKDVDHLTEEAVDSLGSQYLENYKNGRENFIPLESFSQHYKMSKILVHAYGRTLAKLLSSRPDGSKVYVNVMSPGLTSTDLNRNFPGGRTLENGADTAVWLALLPRGGPNGQLLRDRAEYHWEEEVPKENS